MNEFLKIKFSACFQHFQQATYNVTINNAMHLLIVKIKYQREFNGFTHIFYSDVKVMYSIVIILSQW